MDIILMPQKFLLEPMRGASGVNENQCGWIPTATDRHRADHSLWLRLGLELRVLTWPTLMSFITQISIIIHGFLFVLVIGVKLYPVKSRMYDFEKQVWCVKVYLGESVLGRILKWVNEHDIILPLPLKLLKLTLKSTVTGLLAQIYEKASILSIQKNKLFSELQLVHIMWVLFYAN